MSTGMILGHCVRIPQTAPTVPAPPIGIFIGDLDGAIRAEMVITYCGGHVSTIAQKGNRRHGDERLLDHGHSPIVDRSRINPRTVVSYQLPLAGNVRLVACDLLGREVAVLVNERKESGRYEVGFDARGLSSGVYLYRLAAGVFVQTQRMQLLR
jgi:hypothetical protein